MVYARSGGLLESETPLEARTSYDFRRFRDGIHTHDAEHDAGGAEQR